MRYLAVTISLIEHLPSYKFDVLRYFPCLDFSRYFICYNL